MIAIIRKPLAECCFSGVFRFWIRYNFQSVSLVTVFSANDWTCWNCQDVSYPPRLLKGTYSPYWVSRHPILPQFRWDTPFWLSWSWSMWYPRALIRTLPPISLMWGKRCSWFSKTLFGFVWGFTIWLRFHQTPEYIF